NSSVFAANGARDFFIGWNQAPRIERIGLADPLDAGPSPFVTSVDGGSLGEAPLVVDCSELFTLSSSNTISAYDLQTRARRVVGTIASSPYSTVQDEIFLYFATANNAHVSRMRKSGETPEEILMPTTVAWYLAIDDEALYLEEHTGNGTIYRMAK